MTRLQSKLLLSGDEEDKETLARLHGLDKSTRAGGGTVVPHTRVHGVG